MPGVAFLCPFGESYPCLAGISKRTFDSLPKPCCGKGARPVTKERFGLKISMRNSIRSFSSFLRNSYVFFYGIPRGDMLS